MYVADALSRNYLQETEPMTYEYVTVCMVNCIPISETKLNELKQETEKDVELQTWKQTVLNDWPEKIQKTRKNHLSVLEHQRKNH